MGDLGFGQSFSLPTTDSSELVYFITSQCYVGVYRLKCFYSSEVIAFSASFDDTHHIPLLLALNKGNLVSDTQTSCEMCW